MANVSVIFNGTKVDADDSLTILDLAAKNDIKIPTLCYDKRLDPSVVFFCSRGKRG